MPTFRKLVRLSAIPIGIWVASIGVAELAFRALGVQLSSSMAIIFNYFLHAFLLK